MVLRNLLLVIALVVLIVAHSDAFTPPLTGSRLASSSVTTTAVGFFGLFGKNDEPEAADSSTKKVKKIEEKKKPNPFVPGKGRYDWVKNKKVSQKDSGAFSWSTKQRTTED
jgi:hypothetical protein